MHISNLFITPPIYQSIQQRYRTYRQNGTSVFSAFFMTLVITIGWVVLRFESPSWQWIRTHNTEWFPHISSTQPRPGDLIRYLIQSLWLILFRHGDKEHLNHRIKKQLHPRLERYYAWLSTLPKRIRGNPLEQRIVHYLHHKPHHTQVSLLILAGAIAAVLMLLNIVQPFGVFSQITFLLILWGIAMSVRKIPGRVPTLILMILSVTVSCRYLWWRYTATLNWNDPLSLTFGSLLIGAETYAWIVLILGYFQSIWPLNRQPVPLPADSSTWPTVDFLIPTYNEDLDVVKPCVYAALALDWPKDKITIYMLDDGNRPNFKAFAEEVGINYIARPTHEHAKAGNINYALKYTKSELVTIFDCDHIAASSFLQLTVGWFFKDRNLALVQTPHHFFSPDPFERNLKHFRSTPNEGALFYGLLQNGNDTWDATFFCGSCGILRRTALDKIGGIATETVTEDAHTSLRLQRQGYTSAYIRIPLAAGLATESLSAHIGQRIRWARGMTQIFRLDNPLLGKGLTWPQRLCYTNAMLYFLAGIPRLIFLTAPLAFLLFHAYIIYAPALMILLYALPHLAHATITNSRIQGKYRHIFWSEIYETVLAWYIAWPTTVAMFNPHKGKFNVTSKGGLVKQQHVDWKITRPYIFLLLLNLVGVIAGLWRLHYGPTNEMSTVFISLAWVVYNVLILRGAMAVSVEAKQIRKSHRVEIRLPAAIALSNGYLLSCTLLDYSSGGVGIEVKETYGLKEGDEITLLLKRGQQEHNFPCRITRVFGNKIGMRLEDLSVAQQINFIQCTFARADTWTLWQNSYPVDKPMQSIRDILTLNFQGYSSMLNYPSQFVHKSVTTCKILIAWLKSFVPHSIGKNRVTPQHNATAT